MTFGHVLDVVVEGLDVQLLQRLARERLDRDRHVLDVLIAALRGDGHLADRKSRLFGGGCRIGWRRCVGCCGVRAENGCYSGVDSMVRFQADLPDYRYLFGRTAGAVSR